MYDELIDDHPSISVIYGDSNEISITVFSSLRPASTRTRRRNINWLLMIDVCERIVRPSDPELCSKTAILPFWVVSIPTRTHGCQQFLGN